MLNKCIRSIRVGINRLASNRWVMQYKNGDLAGLVSVGNYKDTVDEIAGIYQTNFEPLSLP
jgi:hypothetical protein